MVLFADRHVAQELLVTCPPLLEIFAGYISISIQNVLDARQAQEIAKRDNLTGLFNDRYLHVALAEAIRTCREKDQDLALLLVDLDYFKPLGSNQGMQVLPNGTVRLARHFSDRMEKQFGEPRRLHSEITQRDMDLAYGLQHRFEEIFFHLLKQLHKQVPCDDLAIAGGCALNSVANGKVER